MQEIVNTLRQVDTTPETLRRGNFEASAHAGGSGETTILSLKASQPLALRQGMRYRFVPVARETFTTDGTADNTETFTLSHNLIDSSVSDDLVLFEGSNQVQPDSVDYGADSFDYTDDGTDNSITAYYVAATQAQIKLKKVGPGGSTSETLVEHDAALINQRDPDRDPLTFDLNASPLQAVIPSDWSLEWTVTGPFNAGYDPDNDPTPVNFLVSIPIRRAAPSEIPNLGSHVRRDSSQRV